MRRTAASDLPPRGLITQRAPTLTDIPVRHLPSAPPLPTRVHTQPFLAHASVPGGLTQSGNYRRFEDLDYEIAPKSSILLPHLQANEKKFFELVHSGKLALVVTLKMLESFWRTTSTSTSTVSISKESQHSS